MIAKNPIEVLKQVQFLAARIAVNESCIGSNLCHVDGNCTHCTADTIHRVASRFLNLKVFKVSDIEWYLGENADEAVLAYSKDCGVSVEKILEVHKPFEVTEEALDKLTFTSEGEIMTFRKQLNRRISDGQITGLFATSEW